MPDHDRIYREEAARYHEMIASQPDLRAVVEDIVPVAGLDVVDLGAGTGRLSVPLAKGAKSLVALNASAEMLEIAAERLREAGCSDRATTRVADHRSLPLPDDGADLVVSGWSVCYLCGSDVPGWQDNLAAVISEIKRIVRPGGTAILFETKPYYRELTETYGFSHRWIRLDYEFEDAGRAERLSRFFFGDELADRVARDGSATLPECAGVWWLKFA